MELYKVGEDGTQCMTEKAVSTWSLMGHVVSTLCMTEGAVPGCFLCVLSN